MKYSVLKKANRFPVEGVILFIHGITGTSHETFLSNSEDFDWFADLSNAYPSWEISAIDYDSSLWSSITCAAAKNEGPALEALATELAHELIEHLNNPAKIVVVCHSMGGLLYKILACCLTQTIADQITSKVKGVMFLGTPHYGAGIAARLSRLTRSISSRLVHDLADTNFLRRLDAEFSSRCMKLGVAVVNFVEQVSIVAGLRIVRTEEGFLAWRAHCRNIELSTDHIQISKPNSARDLQVRELRWLVENTFYAQTSVLNIFAHFLDHHIQERAGQRNEARIQRVALFTEQALKLSLLVADNVFVHAGFYYESALSRKLIDSYEARFLGKVHLFGNANNLLDYVSSSFLRFKDGDEHQLAYKFDEAQGRLDFVPTSESATETIRRHWIDFDPEHLLQDPKALTEVQDRLRFLREWSSLPHSLEGLAMIPKYVLPVLGQVPGTQISRLIIDLNANSYYSGILRRLNCRYFSGIPFFPSISPTSREGRGVDFKAALKENFVISRLLAGPLPASAQELCDFFWSYSGADACLELRAAILSGNMQ